MSAESTPTASAPAAIRAPAGRQRGFTLTELIITVAIGGILASIAVPSFRTMSQNNRLVTETNSLIGDIQLTRSEAAKRSVSGIVCSSAAPMATNPACGSTFAAKTGWVTCADVNGDGDCNNAADAVIRRRSSPPGEVTITATSNKLTFLSTGALSGGTATIAICDDRTDLGSKEHYGREVTISPTGRPSLTVGNAETPITDCTLP